MAGELNLFQPISPVLRCTDVSQKSEPSFDVRIRALSDPSFAVTLGVVFVATYPKSPPLLTIKDDGDLREATRFKIQKFIETESKSLAAAEQEMILQLVEGIREILDEAAVKKAQGQEMPSLEEERAAHEAEMAKKAQAEKELEERRRLEESQEEQRVLGDMLQEELKRQKTRDKELRKKTRGPLIPSDSANTDLVDEDATVVFDQPCKIMDGFGNELYFKSVTDRTTYREGPVTTVYKVKPVLLEKTWRPTLALKQVELKCHTKDSVLFKKQLQALETQLETVKKLRHPHLLELIDYRIDRFISDGDSAAPAVWSVSILNSFSDRGSLDEFLDLAGQLNVNKAKIWTTDLLDALTFLHNHGIVHQDVHPGNILLCREPAGDVVPKLADSGFQRDLHNICTKVKMLTSTRAAKSAYWFPPEVADVSKPQYTQKTDVWDFGVVFLQMLLGLDIADKYSSPSALMDSLSLSGPLKELVSKFFKTDPKKRPRASELTSSEFLATNAPILDEVNGYASNGTASTLPQGLPRMFRHGSVNRNETTSRYLQDYVEEARLGKGGFGEVVKARRLIDSRLYAVKKITQRSKETLSELLKEVRMLSSMNHPSVVRYINTWVEEVPEYPSEDDASSDSFGTIRDANRNTADFNIEFAESKSRGLDFMSSSGHPYMEGSAIESSDEDDEEDEEADDGDDSDEDDDDDDDDEDESSSEGSEDEDDSDDDDDTSTVNSKAARDQLAVPGHRTRRTSSQRHYKSTLYIVMEYCEKRVGGNPI
jgi:translation initiation factor 2-alpha kinase 4